MRALALAVLVFSGCVTSAPAQRIALATIPGTPDGLMGGSGVGLAARALAGEPEAQPEGGAVALPTVQPELGVVFRVDAHSRFNVKASLATAAVAKSPTSARALPDGAVAMEVVIGGARDIPFGRVVGAVLGCELGVSGISLTEISTFPVLLPSARAAAGFYVEPGPVRIFAAATLGTGTWNDANSVVTRTCGIFCVDQSTGSAAVSAVALVGGGVRWQLERSAAIAAEAWVPVTSVATRLPITVALTVRIGDFDLAPARRAPPPGAAPPRGEPDNQPSPSGSPPPPL